MKDVKVALVSKTKRLTTTELNRVASALQRQLTTHFEPIWNIHASIRTFTGSAKVPEDYWPITVRDKIEAGMMSYHSLSGTRPFVEVSYGKYWTLGASHDLLEMLVDPKLNRTVIARSIVPGDRRNVKFPVQICDPCASPSNGYRIDGILVADFSTPDYWYSKSKEKEKYSFMGSLTRPFEVLPGAYLSWQDPKTRQWKTFWGPTGEAKASLKKATSSNDQKIGSIRVSLAGRVKYGMVVFREILTAREADRRRIQVIVEGLIEKFG